MLSRSYRPCCMQLETNFGGATIAFVMAEFFDPKDLALPAILVGSFQVFSGLYIIKYT
jgi:hypothetical protein